MICILKHLAFTDPDNEAKVQAAFNVLAKGKTVLMIAHRLSTVTGADRIVVIKDGKIEDTGTHNRLKDKNGLYAEMWRQYIKSIFPLRDAPAQQVADEVI